MTQLNLRVEQRAIKLILSRKETFFLFKCLLGLYDLDLSYYLLTADSSKYNFIHANYQLKIRYARTNILKFSYFFREAN